MSLNSTPSGERKHISIFGCRNAGKSSLLNAIAGQEIAIVSDIAGTTTDPVKKAIELLPAGPVMLTDTPGLDDEGILGDLRIDSAKKILRRTDLAIVVIDSQKGESEFDLRILKLIKEQNIPYIKVWNKCDIKKINVNDKKICVSALTGEGINKLKDQLALMLNEINNDKSLVGDIVNEKDTVVLVIPIDKAAPKARLILPQQQTIRDLLDHGAVSVCIRDTELKDYISENKNKISLVITDSQVVKKVSEIVPEDIPLTTFSILFSKYKGELETQLDALRTIDNLKDGDWVLIAEGCSHHRQCGDIGSEKIPAMLNNIANINFDFTSGLSWPEDLSKYKLIIHCGACMLNEKEMKARINKAKRTNVPITNYGMLFSKINGVLDRTIKAINQNV